MYTLRIPFKVPPDKEFNPDQVSITEGAWEAKLKAAGDHYAFVIQGLSTWEEAESLFNRAWQAFGWLLLEGGVAARWSSRLQSISESDDPEAAARNVSASFGGLDVGPELHGLIRGEEAAIWETEKNIYTLSAMPARIIHGIPPERIADSLLRGFISGKSGGPKQCQFLRLATEVYSASYFEASDGARFLSHMTVLEILAKGLKANNRRADKKPPSVVELIEGLRRQVVAAREKVEENDPLSASLNKLQMDIGRLKNLSITDQIEMLVFNSLREEGTANAESASSAARDLYNKRGQLVHSGQLQANELSVAVEASTQLVRKVLTAHYHGTPPLAPTQETAS